MPYLVVLAVAGLVYLFARHPAAAQAQAPRHNGTAVRGSALSQRSADFELVAELRPDLFDFNLPEFIPPADVLPAQAQGLAQVAIPAGRILAGTGAVSIAAVGSAPAGVGSSAAGAGIPVSSISPSAPAPASSGPSGPATIPSEQSGGGVLAPQPGSVLTQHLISFTLPPPSSFSSSAPQPTTGTARRPGVQA